MKFEKDSLTNVMKDFYLLTGIRIVVFDSDLNMIASMPDTDTPFCASLKRNKEFEKLCEKCTQKACLECKKRQRLNIYRCHAGLIEAISPVSINGALVGYIMLGQIITKENYSDDKKRIIKYISKYTNSAEEIFSELTVKDEAFIEASVKIMECCASYLLMKKLIITDKSRIIDELTTYIENNISSPISTDDLCDKFFISRNMLYRIFNESFGTTAAKYIKKQKIERAKELISSGASITEAAYSTGYNDSSYFSKVFKEETGVLPTVFKKCLNQ
ncbi:MAG: helix-turn-helix domain-containing protein [Ruminococcaceae bacterium]|nr:helix-turn-helix domain-containing protein [Oscillospiraceae bacterium]